jgi:hypothetical protein
LDLLLLLLLLFVKRKGFCGCSIVFWRERLTQTQTQIGVDGGGCVVVVVVRSERDDGHQQ